MGSIGVPELVVIFLVLLLLFGAKRLPEIAQGLGRGIRDFKKSIKDTSEAMTSSDKEKDNSLKTKDKKDD